MAIGRAERREQRRPQVVAVFGDEQSDTALDLLEIVEMAWHDCYGEVTPPDRVVDDMLLLSDGRLDELVAAAKLALADWRDLRVAADRRRNAG